MTKISFRERHSLALRVWHWTTFVVIAGSLVTVLINKTFLSPRRNIPLIQQKLAAGGAVITPVQARSVAGMLSHRVWDWHAYIGLVLSGLFVFRLVLELFQPKEQRLRFRLRNSSRLLRLGVDSWHTRHYFFVKLAYALFYLLLALIVLSGLWLTYADSAAWLHAGERKVKEVHNFCMYLALAFIFGHIAGVIIEEVRGQKGVTSDMIHGGD